MPIVTLYEAMTKTFRPIGIIEQAVNIILSSAKVGVIHWPENLADFRESRGNLISDSEKLCLISAGGDSFVILRVNPSVSSRI